MGMSDDKIIMLHEAVVAPLNVLKNVYLCLNKFKNDIIVNCHISDLDKLLKNDTVIVSNKNNVKELVSDAKEGEKLKNNIQNLLNLCTNLTNLVEISVGYHGTVNVNLSKLEDICGIMLNQIKDNLNSMRMEFSNSDLLKKYEDLKNVGSTSFLEEELMEKLFRNRDNFGINVVVS